MRKKWAVIIVAFGILFILGYSLLSSRNPSREIVVFLPSAENPFWMEVRRGVQDKANSLGSSYGVTILASGDLDAASQVSQLKSVLDRGRVDAIVIGVANNKAPAPTIASYNKAGIPVVMIDTTLDDKAAAEAGASWNAFIGSDNRLGGEKAAMTMAEALSKRGKRVLLIKGSFVHQSAVDRAEGFISAAHGRLEVVEREGEWSQQRANELTTGVMIREPVDGIFASNDDMALGAIAALKNLPAKTGRAPIVVGFDATIDGLRAIKSGDMYASVRQDAYGMGEAGVSLAVKLLRGESVSRKTLIPVNVVTSASMDMPN
jgi:ribose transport system substrate-binding protein